MIYIAACFKYVFSRIYQFTLSFLFQHISDKEVFLSTEQYVKIIEHGTVITHKLQWRWIKISLENGFYLQRPGVSCHTVCKTDLNDTDFILLPVLRKTEDQLLIK